MNRPIRRTERGFTLIEMLVVVAIVGSILAVAMPRFLPMNSTARAFSRSVT